MDSEIPSVGVTKISIVTAQLSCMPENQSGYDNEHSVDAKPYSVCETSRYNGTTSTGNV